MKMKVFALYHSCFIFVVVLLIHFCFVCTFCVCLMVCLLHHSFLSRYLILYCCCCYCCFVRVQPEMVTISMPLCRAASTSLVARDPSSKALSISYTTIVLSQPSARIVAWYLHIKHYSSFASAKCVTQRCDLGSAALCDTRNGYEGEQFTVYHSMFLRNVYVKKTLSVRMTDSGLGMYITRLKRSVCNVFF